MNLKIYNATHDQISSNKFPIFIGISVGAKKPLTDTVLSYLQWAKEHASETVQILIADEIAKFNYLAGSHYTKPGAHSRAIRDGDAYHAFFEKLINTFEPNDRRKFNIVRWKNIINPRYNYILDKVTKEFENNAEFRQVITSFAEKHMKRRNKVLTKEKKMFLCQYILHELPTLLDGIYVDDKNYNLVLYPTYTYSGMSKMISDIQNSKKFKALSKKLNLKKTIMVEMLISKEN